MSVTNKLRNNKTIRGFFFLWKEFFGGLARNKFGYVGNEVILTPPSPVL